MRSTELDTLQKADDRMRAVAQQPHKPIQAPVPLPMVSHACVEHSIVSHMTSVAAVEAEVKLAILEKENR